MSSSIRDAPSGEAAVNEPCRRDTGSTAAAVRAEALVPLELDDASMGDLVQAVVNGHSTLCARSTLMRWRPPANSTAQNHPLGGSWPASRSLLMSRPPTSASRRRVCPCLNGSADTWPSPRDALIRGGHHDVRRQKCSKDAVTSTGARFVEGRKSYQQWICRESPRQIPSSSRALRRGRRERRKGRKASPRRR
ncbi:hypothetical protein IQ17_00108 [Bradyrhizobium daqingense]|uniref:Uncharacterized protein n=1 Tax=Bradyrhizobium daqingense TaxID=993502 RepID=A0A562LTL3_9BRAD|nr:hypothetical protein IQ17_00108 [Bradyrhizobium daqingense]